MSISPSKAAAEARPGSDRATGWKGRYALFLLFLIAIFNAADRQILAVLLVPIQAEFGMSDTAMGILNGLVFSVFYALAVLPIARLADVRPRNTIIAAGLFFWSGMTAAGGVARSFGHLVLARVGVGIGEASFVPAAMSTTSDYFPAGRRTLAFSALTLGLPVGAMLSLVIGGRLEAAFGWRMTLVWIGVAGMILAIATRLTLREPRRGGTDGTAADVNTYAARETVAYLWRLRSYRHIVIAASLAMFVTSGVRTWAQAFLQRAHDLDVAQAGAALGPALGIGGVLGLLVGGGVIQSVAHRDERWLLWMPALSVLCAVPFLGLFLWLPTASSAVPAYIGVAFFNSAWTGAVMATVQGLAKVRMRALAGAMASLCLNLVGGSLGPLAVGAVSDALRPTLGDASLRYAIAVLAGVGMWAALHFIVAARSLQTELALAVGPGVD